MGKFVSRAGEKLQFALERFNISVKDFIVADFGSSTGGFVDCLLQNGVRRVYAVEVGYGTLDWKLRNNPRVIVMERTNAMHVVLPEKMDLITVDTGWTRQKDVLPNAFRNLKGPTSREASRGTILSLIKPHYEIGKARLKVGQVEKVLQVVQEDIKKVGARVEKIVESPITGAKGKNKEYLALIKSGF